jgi:hypothetical protein
LPSAEHGGTKTAGKNASWILAAALCLYLFLFLCLMAQPLQSLLRLAFAAAQDSPAGPLGQLFYRFASSAAVIPAEDYVQKVMRWVNALRWGTTLLGVFSLLLAALAHSLTGIRAQLLVFRSPRVRMLLLLAAAALGLSTSIRLLGPLAGLMVCAVALVRLRARAVALLAAYGLAAMGVCLLSWPFLWADPIHNFSSALSVMTNFPDPFPVRFFGQFYLAQDLPPSFIPVIMGITLTEPAVLLTLAGLALAVWQLFRRGKDRAVITFLLCYLLLPIAAWMVWRPPLYDNGRQYLFVFPAAFAFCGLAIEALFAALQKWGRVGKRLPRLMIPLILTVLAILPGLAAGAKIHPYQYVYYNAFVGGQAGAFRRFEVDYWLTSYKEVARYLNASAPQGASIVVFGSVPQLQMYTDPSFRIQKFQNGTVYDADFALLATRSDVDLDLFPAGKLIYTVGREGAVYAVLKKLK